jgi:hypothetical protein
MAFEPLGKLLIYIGVVVVVIGGFFLLLAKVPWFGKLPGDISIQRDSWTIIIPFTTMLIVSIVLTVVINLIFRK